MLSEVLVIQCSNLNVCLHYTRGCSEQIYLVYNVINFTQFRCLFSADRNVRSLGQDFGQTGVLLELSLGQDFDQTGVLLELSKVL